MKTPVLACLLLWGMSGAVSAAIHGHGHVQVRGSILDTACAIAAGDEHQSIEIGIRPVEELLNGGHSPVVPFTIHLVNCVLNGNDDRGYDHWKDVRIVFDGEADGNGLFALHGDAKGEALIIADDKGTRAEPGKAIAGGDIHPGSMALHYQMWLTSDHHALRPGRLYTTVRYFMEYD